MVTEIYCSDCKHCISLIECGHPDNKKEVRTYYAKELKHHFFSPHELNKNYDCRWFEWKEPRLTLKQNVLLFLKICFLGVGRETK